MNKLQSNAAVIAQIRKERGSMQRNSIPEMLEFMSRLNIEVNQL